MGACGQGTSRGSALGGSNGHLRKSVELKISVESKAVSRFACHRTPKRCEAVVKQFR